MTPKHLWKHPLEGLTANERLRQVVSVVHRLEGRGQAPTQIKIAEELQCLEKWSDIDRDLQAALKGEYDGLLKRHDPLLESTGPFEGTQRGSAEYYITDAGRKYIKAG